MAEAKTTVSRRSARLFEEQDAKEMGEMRCIRGASIEDREREREKTQRGSRSSTNSVERRPGLKMALPIVDLGNDIGELFPKLKDDMGQQVTKILQSANDLNEERIDGRPINFGHVIPGRIYRSSFPMAADFKYISTLGLKTIVSLVHTDFDPAFKAFMTANGINHCVINMDGTKKVAIPAATMQSIMQVVLDQWNHPLLLHCNHGKHRTGCAVAVIRLVAGWNVEDIISEYEGHAAPKIREVDIKYIRAYQISSLKSLFNQPLEREPDCPPPASYFPSRMNSTTAIRLLVGSGTALLIWIATWSSFKK